LWEIVVKVRVGKLEADIRDIVAAVNAQGFETLEIRPSILRASSVSQCTTGTHSITC
jgi:PIN domain nuclease of toxin-antitoxin system